MTEKASVQLYDKYEAVMRFPILKAYLENFENTSMMNPIPGLLSFFFIQGQITIPYIRLPTGDSHLDLRVHVFWIQPSRSGKSIAWNYIGEVLKAIDIPSVMYSAGTDAGLVGTIEEVKDKDGNIETKPVEGLLSGRKCLNFDEGSMILAPGKHSQDTVLFLQTACNAVGSDNNIITKHMRNNVTIENESLISLWITTYPPKGVKEYVLTKGIFQRVLLHWGDWDMDKRQEVSGKRIETFGKRPIKTSMDKEAVTDYFKDAGKRLRDRVLGLAEISFTEWDAMDRKEQEEVVQNHRWDCFSYDDDFRTAMQQAKDEIFDLIRGMDPSMKEVVASFEPGVINYLAIFATHLAILDKSWEVKAEYVDMAHEILYDIYKNLISWLEDEVDVGMKESEKSHHKEKWINCYNECSAYDLDGRGDGWRRKSIVMKRYIAVTGVSQATVSRHYKNYAEKMFRVTNDGSTKYIKLKGESNGQ